MPPATTVPPTTQAPTLEPMQDGWPLVRHDASSGGATNAQISLSPAMLWSKDIYASTPPVVEYEHVYIGVRRIGTASFHGICCLDLHGGDVVWTYEFDEIYQISHSFHSSPAVSQGKAFFVNTVDGETFLTCCDALTSESLWNRNVSSSDIRYASPIIVDNALYLTQGENWHDDEATPHGTLERYDLTTGELAWQRSFTRFATGAASYDNGMFFVATYDFDNSVALLYGIDAETGIDVWNRNISGTEVYDVSLPISYNGAAYVAISTVDNDYDYIGEIYCLDQATGNTIWYGTTEDSYYSGWQPCIVGDFVIVPTVMDQKSTLNAFDLNSGSRAWQRIFSVIWGASSSSNTVLLCANASSPYANPGKYYHMLRLYDAQAQRTVWERTMDMEEADYWIDAMTPAIAGGKIVVAMGATLNCYG